MGKIKEKHLVTKRNVLNELRTNNMTLQELRFFSIYLSKINPQDTSTRLVRFPLEDFRSIMELGRMNIQYLKEVTNSLLSKVVNVPTERGGYTGFQLFKECTVDTDDFGEWYVEIDAHDKALPLMFDFKKEFFSYELWNALRLKSSNQLRMYELLKQYERIGYKVMLVDELKACIGIKKDEYPRFDNFKMRVLDACQQALAENTDISFTYEPYGRKGRGGKILALKFSITKNKNYVDPLGLDEFIDRKKVLFLEVNKSENNPNIPEKIIERINFLNDACKNEFTFAEMDILYVLVSNKLMIYDDMELYQYFNLRYKEFEYSASKVQIHDRFAYFKSMLEQDKSK